MYLQVAPTTDTVIMLSNKFVLINICISVSLNLYYRDDQQLLGNLTNAPSNSCVPYAYGNDSKPIVPCGAIADAMFTGR